MKGIKKAIFAVILILITVAVCFLFAEKRSDNQGYKRTASEVTTDMSHTQLENRIPQDRIYSEVSTESYIQDGFEKESIKITYPKFRNEKIDRIIKKEALSILAAYNDEDMKSLSADIGYTVSLRSDEVISVLFMGYRDMRDVPHPTHVFYTVNIDLKTGKKIYLKDIVSDTEKFAETIRDQNFIFRMKEDENTEHIIYTNEYFPFETIGECDLNGALYSYLTDEGIGISFQVSHAIGDHKEIELSAEMIDLASRDVNIK